MKLKSITRMKLRYPSSACVLFAIITLASFQLRAQALTGAEVASGSPGQVVLTFDKTDMEASSTTGFSVLVNSSSAAIIGISAGTKITLDLDTPVKFGDVVQVSYDNTAGGDARSTADGNVTTFINQTVTNNLPATVKVKAPGLSNICVGDISYFALGDIVISERAADNFVAEAKKTLILSVPVGFKFEAGAGNVTFGGTDITEASVTLVTENDITITYTAATTASIDSLVVSGLKVRATTALATGKIFRTGGTATQAGNSKTDGLEYASLSAGASSCTTNIVAATGGTDICAGNASYFPLSDIVIREGLADNFAAGTDVTLVLDAPTDFEFEAGVGSVAFSGTDITKATIGVTSTQITITYTVATIADLNTFTVSGIKVKATKASASGKILRSDDGAGAGVQTGNTKADGLEYATLSSGTNSCFTSVTVATGVTNICVGGIDYFSLSDIIISEGIANNFATGTDVTLVLDAPTDFEFEAGVGSVAFTGTDITKAIIGVTNTQITVTYTVAATADLNTFTISGIKVKATKASASGKILRSDDGAGAGVQAGNSKADALEYASLSAGTGNCETSIVQATGGSNICVGSYVALSDIIIKENAIDNFATGTDVTLVLDAPTDFEFEAGVGNVSFTGTDVTKANATITSTQITITYTVATVADLNTFTITGVKVKATKALASGKVLRTDNGAGAGTQAGNSKADGLEYATLSSGANSCFTSVAAATGARSICVGDISYFPLSDITISEGVTDNFATGTDVTLVLDAPTDFEFEAGVGSVAFSGTDITKATIGVTSTQITITYTVATVADLNAFTISGIKVKATKASASGKILRSDDGAGAGVQAGNSKADALEYALLGSGTDNCETSIVQATGATNICVGSYVALSDIIIREGAIDNFAVGTDVTLVLGVPANFEFEANSGNVAFSGTDITKANISIDKDKVTLTYTVATVADINSFTISGLKVKATAISSSGKIFRTDDGASAGTQTGNSKTNALEYASLSSKGSNCLTITSTIPAHTATDVVISSDLVIDFGVTNVKAGSGNISLVPVNGGTTIEFDVTGSQVDITGSKVTINPSNDLVAGVLYEVTMPAGVILANDATNESFAGFTTGEWQFTASKALALKNVSPASNSVGVAIGSNIVFTYYENIKANTSGKIRLDDGASYVDINITDVTQISISNNTLTINPTNDLNPNRRYTITMGEGVVQRSSDGNNAPALSLSFSTAITISAKSPIDKSTNVATDASFIITYDAAITANRNAQLRNITSGGTINVGMANEGSNAARINVGTLAANTQYELLIPTGIVSANGGAGAVVPAVNTKEWVFSTVSAAKGMPGAPTHNQSDVAIGLTTLVIDYDKAIEVNTGEIILTNVTAGNTTEKIDVTDPAKVSISGTKVTITCSALVANTEYTVAIPAAAFKEVMAPKGTVAALPATSWVFKTVSAITLDSFTPGNTEKGVAVTSRLTMTFSADVQIGTGTVLLTNKTNNVHNQTINIATASVSGRQVTLLNADLQPNAEYEVTFGNGVVLAATGAHGQVAGKTSDWVFTTASGITADIFFPAHNASNVSVSVKPEITYSSDIQIDITKGDIKIKPKGGTAVTVNAKASTSGKKLLLNLDNLLPNTEYEITVDANVVKAADPAHAEVGAIATQSWVFTTRGDVTITVPVTTLCMEGGYVTIAPIVIAESTSGTFGTGAGLELVLDIPANYELEADVGSVSTGGADIQNAGINVTANLITITYDVATTNDLNSISISGLRIKANAGAVAGMIANDGTKDAKQQGNNDNTKHATLQVVARPSAPIISNPADICQGVDISTQIVNPGGMVDYIWYSEDKLKNVLYTKASPRLGNDLQASSANVGTTVFYVTHKVGDCESDATPVTMTVTPTPVVSLISSVAGNTICKGEPITFTAVAVPNTSATYTFKHSVIGDLSPIVGNSVTSKTLTSGDITVEVKIGNCTVTSSAISLVVKDLPTLTYQLPSVTNFSKANAGPIALSDVSSFGAKINGTFATLTEGKYSSDAGVIGTNFYPSLAKEGDNVITYTYQDATSNCSSSITFTFTVYDPNNAITNLKANYCAGDGKGVAIVPDLPDTYTEKKTVLEGSPVPVPKDVTANYKISDIVMVRKAGGAGAIEGSYLTGYFFNPTTAGSAEITATVTYTNTTPSAYFPLTAIKVVSSTTIINPLPSLTLGGVSEGEKVCTDRTQLILDPQAEGSSINIGTGSFTIKYTRNGGPEQSLATNDSRFVIPGAGAYKIYFFHKNANNCEKTSDPVSFDVYDSPTPSFTFPGGVTAYETCVNKPVDLTPKDGANAMDVTKAEFKVKKGVSGTYVSLGAGITRFDPLTYGEGVYYIQMTYTNANGCVATTSTDLELTVHPLPKLSFTFKTNDATATYCAEKASIEMVPLDGTTDLTSKGTVVFQIKKQGEATFSDQPQGSVAFDPETLGAGVHKIKFTYVDGNKCEATSAEREVIILKLPEPSIESISAYCKDAGPVKLTLKDSVNVLFANQLINVEMQVKIKSAGSFIAKHGSFNINSSNNEVTIDPGHADLGVTQGTPHQIRFVYTNAKGCKQTSNTINLVVNDLPNPKLSFDLGKSGFCVSEGQQKLVVKDDLTELTGAALKADLFTIDKGKAGTFATNNKEVIIDNGYAYVVPGALGTGIHQIKFSYADVNGCKASGVLDVTVHALPQPKIEINGSSAASYCVNSIAQTISVQDGTSFLTDAQLSKATFQLKTGTGAFADPKANVIIISGKVVKIDPAVMGEGSHQLRFIYENDNKCKDTSAAVSITVNALPNLTIDGLNVSGEYCKNAPEIDLRVKDGSKIINELGTVTFMIDGNPTGAVTVNSTFNTIKFRPSDLVAGVTYQMSFSYRDGNNCKSTSISVPITIQKLPVPELNITGGKVTHCVNGNSPTLILKDNIVLTSKQLGKVVFEIDRKNGAGFQISTGDEIKINGDQVTLNPSVLGVGKFDIKYKYTNVSTCEATSNILSVEVISLPVPVINGIAEEYCESSILAEIDLEDNGTNIVIKADNVVFAIDTNQHKTFRTPPLGSIVPQAGSNKVNINPSLLPVGTHIIKYTYTEGNGCEATSGEYKLVISPLPAPTFTGLATTYCDNITNVELTPFDGGSLIVPASKATFSFRRKGTATFSPFSLGNTFSPQQWGEGVYEIKVAYTNNLGCAGSSASIQEVTIEATPKNVKVKAVKYYDKYEVEFSASANGVDPGWTWNWAFGDATTGNTQQITKSLSVASPTLISYSLTVGAGSGCNTTVPKSFEINFDFSGQCIGTNTQFTNLSNLSNPTDGKNQTGEVTWNFGDGSTLTGDAAKQNTVEHQYQKPGTYEVILSIVTKDGLATYELHRRIDIFPVVVVTPQAFYIEDFEAATLEGWLSHGTVKVNQQDVYSTSWRRKQPADTTIDKTYGKAWITDNRDDVQGSTPYANYYNDEQSYVETPCFNISALDKPVLSFSYWAHVDGGADGVVMQYSIDDGKTWYRLGTKEAKIEGWYNTNGILGAPGSASSTTNVNANEGNQGWSTVGSSWQLAQYSLSGIFPTTTTHKMIRFRMSFGSNGDNPSDKKFEGFAFDNFKIGNRNRTLLLEYFVNDAVAGAPAKDEEVRRFYNSGSSSEITSIHYHAGFPGIDSLNLDNKKDPSARSFYYGVPEAPQIVIDGDVNISDLTAGDLFFKQRILSLSPFAISIAQPTISGANMNIKASVTTNQEFKRPVFIHVVVIDSSATTNGHTYYNVVRKMLPDAAGTYRSVGWATGETQNLDLNWDMGDLKLGTYKVVVFVQDYESREIHQAGVSSFISNARNTKEGENESEHQVTGVNSKVMKQGMKLYPNPVLDYLQAKLNDQQHLASNAQWEISSITGTVFKTGIWAKQANTLSVDIRSLAAGTYLLRVYDKGRVFVLRFQKQ